MIVHKQERNPLNRDESLYFTANEGSNIKALYSLFLWSHTMKQLIMIY